MASRGQSASFRRVDRQQQHAAALPLALADEFLPLFVGGDAENGGGCDIRHVWRVSRPTSISQAHGVRATGRRGYNLSVDAARIASVVYGRLGRDMGVRVYGHWGTPLLAFPTSGGDEWEMEGQGMVAALAEFIDGGRIKLFTVGSNGDQSFYNKGAHPFHRSWMQRQWDEYIRWEVIPFIHYHCDGLVPIATMGASLGAYHAANTLFKHPDAVRACFALSGLYDLRRFMDGHYDDNFYFNNPIDYIGGMTDPGLIGQISSAASPHRDRHRPVGTPVALLRPLARAQLQRHPPSPGRLGPARRARLARTGSTRCGSTSRAI